jgi:hypothetical protein
VVLRANGESQEEKADEKIKSFHTQKEFMAKIKKNRKEGIVLKKVYFCRDIKMILFQSQI